MEICFLGKACTCIEIGGEATDPRIHNFSIGLTNKFGYLDLSVQLEGVWIIYLLHSKKIIEDGGKILDNI